MLIPHLYFAIISTPCFLVAQATIQCPKTPGHWKKSCNSLVRFQILNNKKTGYDLIGWFLDESHPQLVNITVSRKKWSITACPVIAHFLFYQCVCYLLMSPINFEMPAWMLAVLCDCLSQSGRNCTFHTSLHAYYYMLLLWSVSVYAIWFIFISATAIKSSISVVIMIICSWIVKKIHTFCLYVITAEKKTSLSEFVQSQSGCQDVLERRGSIH